jgi:lipid A ethanolaminephosphotransferase
VALKLAALALLFVIAPWGWSDIVMDRVREQLIGGVPIRLAKFTLAFAVCIAALAVLPFLANRRWRFGFAVAAAIGIAIDQMMLDIFGRHYGLELSLLAWVDRANATITLPAYTGIILQAIGLAGLIGLAFAWTPPPALAITHRGATALVAGAFLGCAGLIWGSKADNYDLPAPFAWPAIASQTIVVAAREQTTPRDAVAQTAEPQGRRFRHIVFIVDESVRGDRLTLNDPTWDTTPFLAARRDDLVNYGVATSATNCSNTARMVMRFGIRSDQLPAQASLIMQKPTMWQYARKAGYRTIHVDPFRLVGNFHSGMNSLEAKAIDEMVSVSTLPMPEQDPEIARRLPGLLARTEPSFIYVNKNGVHPVFEKQYPPDLVYEPTGLNHLKHDTDQTAVIRHYHRAVRWSVDGFFRAVWPALQRPDVLTIYTSDHGLALFQGGHAATHCSISGTAVGEGLVPLFVHTTDPASRARLLAAQGRLLNRASHFKVFPTLLWAMGYQSAWIEATYGPSLVAPPAMPGPRRFWTGALNAGGPVSWFHLDAPSAQVR